MKERLLLPIIICILILSIFAPSCNSFRSGKAVDEATEQKDTVYPLGFCTDSFTVVEGKVNSNEIFTTLMKRAGLEYGEALALVDAADSVFDSRKLRAGNSWKAYYSADGIGSDKLRYFVYAQDKVNLVVFDCLSPFGAWAVEKPVEVNRKFADVTINSSLWNDMIAVGVTPLLILKLSDVYAWTIDFFGLQKGDRFRVIFEQKECEGEIIEIGDIKYAVFEHNGKEYPAVWFDQEDGGNVYWNEKGESMRKAFLKAPLKFSRISSGFSYARKHPVHGTVRPHTAVDYAAPTGTPVMSIGDGTVISKGWGGGGGNTVKIRHNSVYTTAYLHLSKYAAGLKVGDRVSQGQVIGYVGMTGTATGPHLDFRVWQNGSPINPLKMESPPTDPLKEEFRPALDSTLNILKQELDSLTVLFNNYTE